MAKHRRLIIVSTLAYFVFLLAMLPLNLVYKWANPTLPVQVVSVSGTFWNGEVVAKHKLTGQVRVNWTLSALPLLWGSAQADLKIDSAGAQASAVVKASALTGEVDAKDVNVYVAAELINQALRANRVSMQGDVELSNASLVLNVFDRQAQSAQGNLVWVGGNVSYPKGRKTKNANLPMLVAKLAADNGELKADVTTADGLAVAKAYAKPDGWGGVSVMRRMIDLVGEPWPNKASPDSTIFDVSERLF